MDLGLGSDWLLSLSTIMDVTAAAEMTQQPNCHTVVPDGPGICSANLWECCPWHSSGRG